jgi:hypothetical protein
MMTVEESHFLSEEEEVRVLEDALRTWKKRANETQNDRQKRSALRKVKLLDEALRVPAARWRVLYN